MIIYLGGVFDPVMEIRGVLMSENLDHSLSYRSGSNIGKQLFWISMLLLSVFNYLKFGGVKLINSSSFLCFVLILILSATSALWSGYPETLTKRLFLQLILIFSIAFSISCLRSRKQLLNIIYYAFSFMAIYNLLFIILFPHYAFDASSSLAGIYKAKNYLGFISLSGLIITVNKYNMTEISKEKKRVILFGTLWAIFLFLSFSKTCVVVAVIFCCFWFFNASRKIDHLFIKILFYCLASFYLIVPILSYVLGGDSLSYFETIFQRVDLTGRGGIWTLAIDSMRENQFFGVGYGTFWGVGEIPFNFDIQHSYLMFLNQSHNGYLDFQLQLGFTGLILLFVFLYLFIKNEYFKLSQGLRFIFIFTLIHNITESSLFRDTHFMWLLFLILVISSWFKLTEENS
jgi:O-antigen ligase